MNELIDCIIYPLTQFCVWLVLVLIETRSERANILPEIELLIWIAKLNKLVHCPGTDGSSLYISWAASLGRMN